MPEKTTPFSKPQIEAIAARYPTPFYLYDERAIRANVRALRHAFAWVDGFREYFAVKALPNPFILKILHAEGLGADCSSLPELLLAEQAGIRGEQIMFSSNDTPASEFQAARRLGAIINLGMVQSYFTVCALCGQRQFVHVRSCGQGVVRGWRIAQRHQPIRGCVAHAT